MFTKNGFAVIVLSILFSLKIAVYINRLRYSYLFHSMLTFLLICPIPALEKTIDPRNTACMPAVKIFSALDLNKFSKTLNIKFQTSLQVHI